jgi:hypothetical protein
MHPPGAPRLPQSVRECSAQAAKLLLAGKLHDTPMNPRTMPQTWKKSRLRREASNALQYL